MGEGAARLRVTHSATGFCGRGDRAGPGSRAGTGRHVRHGEILAAERWYDGRGLGVTEWQNRCGILYIWCCAEMRLDLLGG